MTGLRDLLKKKDKIKEEAQPTNTLSPPEFKFIRSSTGEIGEVIEPPDYPDQPPPPPPQRSSKEEKRHLSQHLGFRRSSNAAETKDATAQPQNLAIRTKSERRLSARLGLTGHRSRSHSNTSTSEHIPEDLPEAPVPLATAPGQAAEDEKAAKEQREAQWEKRATILAHTNNLENDVPSTAPPHKSDRGRPSDRPSSSRTRSRSRSISNAKGDTNIQEAIRLHEIGELKLSTAMFGRLADPNGENNALAQVLYGLALRHGWGYDPEPEKAIKYLSLAASNSANIEEQALASGIKKGGAAKGELVLAIFELANCFRHGWGVKKDAVAARQYYETAANLGDTDAMDEAAWCFLEGFGGAKDKFKAAQYLRLAEKSGGKTVGNSWIWKDKYNPK